MASPPQHVAGPAHKSGASARAPAPPIASREYSEPPSSEAILARRAEIARGKAPVVAAPKKKAAPLKVMRAAGGPVLREGGREAAPKRQGVARKLRSLVEEVIKDPTILEGDFPDARDLSEWAGKQIAVGSLGLLKVYERVTELQQVAEERLKTVNELSTQVDTLQMDLALKNEVIQKSAQDLKVKTAAAEEEHAKALSAQHQEIDNLKRQHREAQDQIKVLQAEKESSNDANLDLQSANEVLGKAYAERVIDLAEAEGKAKVLEEEVKGLKDKVKELEDKIETMELEHKKKEKELLQRQATLEEKAEDERVRIVDETAEDFVYTLWEKYPDLDFSIFGDEVPKIIETFVQNSKEAQEAAAGASEEVTEVEPGNQDGVAPSIDAPAKGVGSSTQGGEEVPREGGSAT